MSNLSDYPAMEEQRLKIIDLEAQLELSRSAREHWERRTIDLEAQLVHLKESIMHVRAELQIAVDNRHASHCNDLLRELNTILDG